MKALFHMSQVYCSRFVTTRSSRRAGENTNVNPTVLSSVALSSTRKLRPPFIQSPAPVRANERAGR